MKNFKDKNNSNYKHGKYCKKYYCIDCRDEISLLAVRCKKCHNVYIGINKKSKCKNYRRNPICIDCGKSLKNKYAQRCVSCSMKHIRRNKFWSVNKNKKMREEQKRKISKTRIERGVAKGSKNPFYKKGKPKCIDCGKQLTNYNVKRCNSCEVKRRFKDLKYKTNWFKKVVKNIKKKPNKPEKLLNKLLNDLLPKEYKYIGNGNFWIAQLNPDFININGQKKIIEFFGDYWHSNPNKYIANNIMYNKLKAKDIWKSDRKRVNTFSKYGYKTLIIWESELDDLIKVRRKILKFNKVRSRI